MSAGGRLRSVARRAWRAGEGGRPRIAAGAWPPRRLLLLAGGAVGALLLGLLVTWQQPRDAARAAAGAGGSGGDKASAPRAERVAMPRVRITERVSVSPPVEAVFREARAPGLAEAEAATTPVTTAAPDETGSGALIPTPESGGAPPGAAPREKEPSLPATAAPAPPPPAASRPGDPEPGPRRARPRPAQPPTASADPPAPGLAAAAGPARLPAVPPEPPRAAPVADPPPAVEPAPAAPPPAPRDAPAEPPVALRVVVGAGGRARSAVVVRSSGDARRDARAVQQALRRRYAAPRRDTAEREVAVEVGSEGGGGEGE